ncbi:MAG: hypothetical protein Q8M76_01050, partial [Spirochaetaceae bacterium]|nr:hypothetical protein [Spirochaetaceae bacterium]
MLFPPDGFDDLKAFEGATVVVKDDCGAGLPLWLSYPGRPDAALIAEACKDNFEGNFIFYLKRHWRIAGHTRSG